MTAIDAVAKPMTAMHSAEEKLGAFAGVVERALEATLPRAGQPSLQPFGAARLVESMRYSLETPGKRLRPLLLLCAADCVGGDASRLARFAAGVEMIHAYSLVHDDLPAMDDDDLRRGRATNHVVFGAGMATLAGDGLFTQAFVVLLDPVAESDVQISVVREIVRAAGYEGMVGGQAADLLAQGVSPDEALLRSMHARKTGALITASTRAGARLAGASAEHLDALTRFAQGYGVAFQIADDVKDEILPTEVSGKRRGGDREAGKMTYPSLFGIEGSRDRLRAELEAALAALGPLGARAAALELLARESVVAAFETNGEHGDRH
jgi:geranylgeranyl diphosphate synthase type II